jgi:chromosome partitioning protein
MSELLERTRHVDPLDCKIVLLASGKGGVGRSTIVRGLLVAAALHNISAIGVDYDPQQTAYKWNQRRDHTRITLTEFLPVEVISEDLSDWRSMPARVRGRRLAFIDTPPTVEHDMPAMLGLAKQADLVLVPTSASPDDLDSVIPWMQTLVSQNTRAAFVMNKVNMRTKSFTKSRSRLITVGSVIPIEIPAAEDIATHSAHGLTVLDIRKSRGAEAFHDLWTYISRELRL